VRSRCAGVPEPAPRRHCTRKQACLPQAPCRHGSPVSPHIRSRISRGQLEQAQSGHRRSALQAQYGGGGHLVDGPPEIRDRSLDLVLPRKPVVTIRAAAHVAGQQGPPRIPGAESVAKGPEIGGACRTAHMVTQRGAQEFKRGQSETRPGGPSARQECRSPGHQPQPVSQPRSCR